jgi:uncharacterized protein (DUF433 family)
MNEDILSRIASNSKILSGKPTIRGTRLSVEFILSLLARGTTSQEIISEYKGLTEDDIRACLLFASKSLATSSFMPLVMESA